MAPNAPEPTGAKPDFAPVKLNAINHSAIQSFLNSPSIGPPKLTPKPGLNPNFKPSVNKVMPTITRPVQSSGIYNQPVSSPECVQRTSVIVPNSKNEKMKDQPLPHIPPVIS